MFSKLKTPNFPRRLTLLDIGARGGVQWPWSELTPDSLTTVMVEPDAVEAERLRQKCVGTNEGVVLSAALWQEGTLLNLNLNRSPGTSSVFKPNMQLLGQFPESDRFESIETIPIKTKTIDQLAQSGEMPEIDFAKIDVQGAELPILKGGVNHLSANLIGLEIEVEFAQLYDGQPLFADVDVYVRENLGLELWDLRGTYWKYQSGMQAPGPTKGRLVFGDALYFRSLSCIENWVESMPAQKAVEKIFMLALSALAYGFVDYAVAVVDAPNLAGYIDKSMREELQQLMRARGSGLRPFRNGNGRLYLALDALARVFKPTHKGWASSGDGLGSRRVGPFWR